MQQPCGDEHRQYGGDELGHLAGIGALQYRIDQGAIVVAGIEDLTQNPDRPDMPYTAIARPGKGGGYVGPSNLSGVL